MTTTSVYRIADQKDGKIVPVVEKIALMGESKIPVGGCLDNGYLIGISRDRICLYRDEDNSTYPTNRTHRRQLEDVNTFFWGGTTSPITALFFLKDEALKCLNASDLKCCDPRWRKQTEEVLAAISDDNPVLVLSQGEFAISFGE
ncbi:MAG: hypothetical protein ABH876_00540 [Patescibacteria group bacterium]|nr:hypothetical protein [Patescibacteria group bacterium]MBU1877128.1 hypothetical protein [Patescibacteria group bacterium]